MCSLRSHFLKWTVSLCSFSISAFAVEHPDRDYCPGGLPEPQAQDLALAALEDQYYQSQPPSSMVPPSLNSSPGSQATIFIDFDGHIENHPFWGTTMTATSKGYTVAQQEKIFRIVSELFMPWELNVTTDSTVFLSAPPHQRQRVVIAGNDVVGGSGQAQAWSFSDSSGAAAYVEASGKGVVAVAATAVHEVGHTLGLRHDGDAGGGVSYPYYNTANWAPVMGGTGSNIDYQWNAGDYQDANNPEDDMAIISGAPNNIPYKIDQQSGESSQAGRLTFSGGDIADTSGIIEYHTDVDAWSFKTSGGSADIVVSSSEHYSVLEPEAKLVNLDNGDEYLMTGNRDQVSYQGSLSAGNYLLSVSSGVYFSQVSEGPSNYGSVGSYSISGSLSSPSDFDGLVSQPVLTLVSPQSGDIQLGSIAPYSQKFIFEVSYLGDYQAYLYVNGLPAPLQSEPNNQWTYVHSLALDEELNLQFMVEAQGEWIESSHTFDVSQNNIQRVLPQNMSVLDFSSEVEDDPRYNLSPALAEYSIDDDRATVWAGGVDSIRPFIDPSTGDTVFWDVMSFEDFPHWIELKFDQSYDLAGIQIQGAESIVDNVPDSLELFAWAQGQYQLVLSTRFERGVQLLSLVENEVDILGTDQIKVVLHSSFSGKSVMGLAEIIPLYYLSKDSTVSLKSSRVHQASSMQYFWKQGEALPSDFWALIDSSHEFKVYNLSGRKLWSQKGKSNSKINSLSEGVYFIVGTNSQGLGQMVILNVLP